MATRTISNAGGNWNATQSWVEGAVPTSADDVVATATSGNLTVTATAAALSVNFTNYVGTFAVNSGVTLTVGGNFTMVSGMTIGATSTGTLSFTASSTLTSGGKVWPGNLTLTAANARTYTLSGIWEVSGDFSVTQTGSFTATLNSSSLTVRGNVTVGAANANNVALIGTTNLILGTTGNQTLTSQQPGAGFVSVLLPITINAAGQVTISTPSARLSFGTFTHTAGAVITTGSTVRWAGSYTISTSGMTWNNVTFGTTSITITLSQAFNVAGTLTLANSVNFQGANNINFSGSSISQTGLTSDIVYSSPFGGACTLLITETCTISQSATLSFRIPVTINAPGKTVTFSTNFAHNQGTFTLTAGTVSMSSSLTWTTAANSTTYNFNTSGFAFPNYVSSVTTTFGGTSGCTFNSFTAQTAGTTYTFKDSNTYTITSGLTLTGTNASRISFASSLANTASILTLLQGATLDVGYANATDIDSSLGQTIWSYRGTLTRTTNWQQLPVQPKTVAHFNI